MAKKFEECVDAINREIEGSLANLTKNMEKLSIQVEQQQKNFDKTRNLLAKLTIELTIF